MAGRILVTALAFSITMLAARQAVGQGFDGGAGGGGSSGVPPRSKSVELSQAERAPLKQPVTLPTPIPHPRPEAEAKILAALSANSEIELVDTPPRRRDRLPGGPLEDSGAD